MIDDICWLADNTKMWESVFFYVGDETSCVIKVFFIEVYGLKINISRDR